MANAQDIIESALRKIRAIGKGRPLGADEGIDGLGELNSMIAEWSSMDLLQPYRTSESLTLTSGTNPHTIGTSGTLNTAQPLDIHDAIVVSSGSDYQLSKMTLENYGAIVDKAGTGRPSRYYFERAFTLGRIYFDWVPDAAYTFKLTSLKAITGFAGLTTAQALPAEYESAMVFNLAIRVASEYGKTPDEIVVATATTTLLNLKRNAMASRVPTLEFPLEIMPGRSRFDIDTGEW